MPKYAYALADERPYLVHGRHGVFMRPLHDAYIGRSLGTYGEYSEIELQALFVVTRPGDVVVEVGANIGAHAIPLARRIGAEGRLHAFEPQAGVYEMLARNVALNRLDNVVLHRAAAGAAPGALRYDPPDLAAVANFGGIAMSASGGKAVTPVVRLDDVIDAPAVALLKIDVEGMEADVLAGAEALIARTRPYIYLENDRRDRSPALIRQLLDMDYRPFWSTPRLYNPDNYFGVAQNVFGGIVSINMFCVPSERLTEKAAAEAIRDPDDRPILNGRRL